MTASPLDIVIFGLSITSSWGNGHATTYRGLVRELNRLGHRTLFLERDVPWYADHRDLPDPPYGRTRLYSGLEELRDRHRAAIRQADVVIIGSFTPDGAAIAEWVMSLCRGLVAFYDIDTPVTHARLQRRDLDYLTYSLIPRYDIYLSFTGGPILSMIERELGSPMARPLYCSFDPEVYRPLDPRERLGPTHDLGYMGTYSQDRQEPLQRLLIEPARRWPEGRFIVAGPLYPSEIEWPDNLDRIDHISPEAHRGFYTSQRFTLNITRAEMIEAGWSPSVRLFEAAACGAPIISDWWRGLESFFTPSEEILVSRSPEDTLHFLRSISDDDRRRIGARARVRAMRDHTAAHRARDLERYVGEALVRVRRRAMA